MAIKESKKGLFDDVKPEKLEKVAETSEDMTVVSVKMSKAERDAFKVYCVQHGMKLSETYAIAAREYMKNHK